MEPAYSLMFEQLRYNLALGLRELTQQLVDSHLAPFGRLGVPLSISHTRRADRDADLYQAIYVSFVLRLVFRPYAACRSRLWRGFRLD